MREAMRRRRAADEAGWTLVELIVSMAIFTILLVIVFSILITVSMQTKDNLARTRAVDQVQLGLMQIDRQVRSGNVISDPSTENSADSGVPQNYSLRVYTQTDGVYQCVQWRVRYPTGSPQGLLEYRSWKPQWASTGGVQPWAVVARNIVKPAGTLDKNDSRTWPPFFQVDPAKGQTITVTFQVKDPSQRASSRPATISSVLTGRNTIYGYPADSCADVPAP